MFKESFLSGVGGGIITTVLCHPLDTLKIRLQTGKMSINNYHLLYRGITPPILSAPFIAACGFTINEGLKSENDSFEQKIRNGIITGTCVSLVSLPFDYVKCRLQTEVLSMRSYSHITRALPITIIKGMIGGGIYYSTYNHLFQITDNAPLSGGITGGVLWSIIQPIDTIKTRLLTDTSPSIYTAYQKGRLYRGVGYAVSRGIVANSIFFGISEFIKLRI